MMTFKKVEAWKTDDGVLHSSEAMAEQYVANRELVSILDVVFRDSDFEPQGQNILNTLSGRLPLVREWIEACEKLRKESLK